MILKIVYIKSIIKNILLIDLISLFLTNCTSYPSQQIIAVEHLFIQQPQGINKLVSVPPKIQAIDWKSYLLPVVQQMMVVDGISDGSLLLVNTMKNNTNGSLQTSKATMMLTTLIANTNNKFQIIDVNRLNIARQMLGLSMHDNLESRSKAIGLARYLDAQYVLYSSIDGDVKQPELDLQLILVHTGEIVWSNKKYK